MSKPKFTPGPWFIREGFSMGELEVFPDIPGLRDHPTISPSEIARVVECGDDYADDDSVTTSTTRANARLIAAAPDLYAALELARERMGGASPGMKAMIAQTDTALSKARGES